MSVSKLYKMVFSIFSPAVAIMLLLAAGCSSETEVHSASPPATKPAGASASSQHASKGRAQLWSENCMRCHNSRSPDSYSDAQWEVAMHHMRLRGDLTAEEHRAILEFLKSSN